MEEILATIRRQLAEEPPRESIPSFATAPAAASTAGPPSAPAASSSTFRSGDAARGSRSWGSGFGRPAADEPAPVPPRSAPNLGRPFPSSEPIVDPTIAVEAKSASSEPRLSMPGAVPSFTPPRPAPLRSRLEAIDQDLGDLIEQPAAEPASSSAEERADPSPMASPPSNTSAPVDRQAASLTAAREKWESLISPDHGPAKAASPPAVSPSDSHSERVVAAPPTPEAKPAENRPPFALSSRSGGFYPPPGVRIEPAPSQMAAAPPAEPAASPADTGAVRGRDASPASKPEPLGQSVREIPAKPSASASAAPKIFEPPASRVPASEPPAPALAAEKTEVGAKLDELAGENPAAAAAAALDALNAGLAAVSVMPGQPAPRADAARSETPRADVRAIEDRPMAASAPSAPSEGLSPAGLPRSFEEVVAEMLRPLLEKWVAENMPRIVERALRLDRAGGPKGGANGTGNGEASGA